ncbi:hypothetical protein C8Q80DRAFT_1274127 [Daedaleopsis nitida]|nr:hypothetical protein C8Q80DRAFT_1274127 [Daedaleopsis nitida]
MHYLPETATVLNIVLHLVYELSSLDNPDTLFSLLQSLILEDLARETSDADKVILEML